MKLVVLGANGHIGAHVVTEALGRGHDVVAYVRNPDAVPPREGLTVVRGSVEDEQAMADAFAGADAVITAIGLRPGAKKPINLMQRSLPVITAAAKKADVGRFVLVSAFGVGETAAMGSPIAKLIFKTLVGAIFRDKALSEQIMPATGLNWTTVYPVNLKQSANGPEVTVKPLADIAKVPGIPTLSFAGVAATLLDIAADQNMSGQRLMLTTDKGWKPSPSAGNKQEQTAGADSR